MMIDVYLIDGHFLPRTEGLELAGKIAAVASSSLPKRVKRMRLRQLRKRLVEYYVSKWGPLPEDA
jgi:hypothetical protein